MKISALFLLFVLLVGAACQNKETSPAVYAGQWTKVMLKQDGRAESFYWEFAEDSALWTSAIGAVPGISSFRDSVKMQLGAELLQKTIDKRSSQSLHDSLLATAESDERYNALLIHTGRAGKVRKINYLEARILNYQISKYPFLSKPTEFHAFMAYHERDGLWRIYFGASDQPWPPRPTALREQLDKDIEQGWRLKYHLHNHYEGPANEYLGILAPSLPDAQYFKMLHDEYHIEKALNTNAFHTVAIEAGDLDQFRSY